MVFRRAFWRVIGGASLLAALFVSFNICLDDFGLFRGSRPVAIFTSERVCKYLLSLRYVPENFDAILVGPSLSDHLDTKGLRAFRTYNLSLLGANASELRLLGANVIERGRVKTLIICLDPFLLRESLINDSRMCRQMYWSALGSTFSFKYYAARLKGYLHPERGVECNEFGAAHAPNGTDSRPAIRTFAEGIRAGGEASFRIDDKAFADLKGLLELARGKKVRVVAFYYPRPYEVFVAGEEGYRGFQRKVGALFQEGDTVWDFNTDEYVKFRTDYGNYSDQGHLSRQGADALLKIIDERLRGIGSSQPDPGGPPGTRFLVQ